MIRRIREWFEEHSNNLRDWVVVVCLALVVAAGLYQIGQDLGVYEFFMYCFTLMGL
jgi:hypothetical protein